MKSRPDVVSDIRIRCHDIVVNAWLEQVSLDVLGDGSQSFGIGALQQWIDD